MSTAKKRIPPNAGKGRKKGVPNKATADVRAAIALFAESTVPQFQEWINRVAQEDPAKAADLFLKAIEYHIPKLARTEVTGADGDPVKVITLPPGAEKL